MWPEGDAFGAADSEAEDGYPDEQSDPEDQSDSRIRVRHGRSYKADTRGRWYEVDARGDKVLRSMHDRSVTPRHRTNTPMN